jgi:hypothetical protein
MKLIRFKRFHDYLIRVATNEKYWGKMKEKDFNVVERKINFGFYGLGYNLLDPLPKLAVGFLVSFYRYKGYEIIINFDKPKSTL